MTRRASRAAAITPDARTCPPGTLDTLRDNTSRVICLGPGGQVLDRGSCVTRPDTDVIARSAVTRTSCDAPLAWARVLSFETSAARCPANSERYLQADRAFRPVTCLDVLSK
ncbi:hypothetical protein ACFLIM_12195 [Nonomuraea sp. M3C6]|uniref:Uncharacterized protein n=1 Tax=Nonomuraea marmarensis TaxID=3351344 RepID=A0ABW7ACR1_9ACTN